MEILYAENLKSLFRLGHGFFTRQGGVSKDIYRGLNCGLSSDDDIQSILENRRLAALQFDVKAENLLSCYQIHSPDVVTVRNPWPYPNRPRADAMVTRQRGLILGILTADCVPLLFASVKDGVIGAAHAGWRGAKDGVIENTLKAMEDEGAIRSNIVAALGPCIWQESYEVGPEFPEPFLSEDPKAGTFFRAAPKPHHFLFDLPGYVTYRLNRYGITNIAPSPANTEADEERFYSFRRNTRAGIKKAGSLLSAIVLTPLKGLKTRNSDGSDRLEGDEFGQNIIREGITQTITEGILDTLF